MTAEATCSDCVVSAILLLLLNYHIYKYVISYVAHNCVFTISSTHVGNKVIKHAHVSPSIDASPRHAPTASPHEITSVDGASSPGTGPAGRTYYMHAFFSLSR
jgi:hypothetical protein